MTNFERIKAMSLDETVSFVYSEFVDGAVRKIFRAYEAKNKRMPTLREVIEVWLESEAEEDES